MPNSSTTFTGGASGVDPVPPTLSKNWVYKDVCDLVRLLSHTSGNTTVITNSEVLSIVIDTVGEIVRENWKNLEPYYLQNNTYAVSGSTNPRTVSYASTTPYLQKIISAVFVYTSRFPISLMSPEELERKSKSTSTYSASILATVFDGFLSLFFGSSFTSPTSYLVDVYYNRQPVQGGITTSNYTTSYVDLPDSYIPELVDRATFRVEMTKQ